MEGKAALLGKAARPKDMMKISFTSFTSFISAALLSAAMIGCEPTASKKTDGIPYVTTDTVGDVRFVNQVTLDTDLEFALDPAIAATADGGFVLAWRHGSNPDQTAGRIGILEFSADGKPGKMREAVPSGDYVGYSWPVVAAFPSGGYVTLWSAYGPGFDGDGTVMAQKPTWAAPRVIDRYSHGAIMRLNALPLDDGGFVTGCECTDSANRFGLHVRRYDAEGRRIGSELLRVSDSVAKVTVWYADIAKLKGGGWEAAWLQEDSLGTLIHGQAFSSDGAPSGEEHRWAGACWADVEHPLVFASNTLDGGVYLSTDFGSGEDCAKILDGHGEFIRCALHPPTGARLAADATHGKTWSFDWQRLVSLDPDANVIAARHYPGAGLYVAVLAVTKAGRIATAYWTGGNKFPQNLVMQVDLIEPF